MIGHGVAWEEVFYGDHSLYRYRDGLHASPSGDAYQLCFDGEGFLAICTRGVTFCQWRVDGVLKVVGPI